MIECPNCGAQNSEGGPFCIRCGSQLSRPEPPQASDTDDTEASRLLDEAAELYAANQLDEAVDACHAALDRDSDLVSARSLLGMIEQDRGNYSAALAEYEAAIRLAPERTAERRRAERVRQSLEKQAGPAVDEVESGGRTRKWLPVTIGIAAALIIVAIGTLLSSRGPKSERPTRPQVGVNPPGIPRQADRGEQADGGLSRIHTLQAGTGGIGGTPIGNPPSDQTDRQRQQTEYGETVHDYSSSAVPPTDRPEFPSSELSDLSAHDLTRSQTAPSSMRQQTEQELTPRSPIGRGSSQQPTAAQRRGKIRISVGTRPESAREQSESASDSRPAQGARPARRGHNTVPTRVQGSQPISGSSTRPLAAGGRHGEQLGSAGGRRQLAASGGGREPGASRVLTGTPGGGTRRTSSTTGTASQSRGTMAVRPESTTRASHSVIRPDHGTVGRSAQAAPSAQDRLRRATTSSGAQTGSRKTPSTAPAPGRAQSGSTSTTSRSLRLSAEQAETTGNLQKARNLYQQAIRGYTAEAAANPSRAAANRSAVESCQRAIQAIDAAR